MLTNKGCQLREWNMDQVVRQFLRRWDGSVAPGRKNLQYSSHYVLKGKAGVGWEMKVSEFGQAFPFPKGHGIWIIEDKISKKVFHRCF